MEFFANSISTTHLGNKYSYKGENVTNHVRVTLGEYTVTTALNLDLRSQRMIQGIANVGVSARRVKGA